MQKHRGPAAPAIIRYPNRVLIAVCSSSYHRDCIPLYVVNGKGKNKSLEALATHGHTHTRDKALSMAWASCQLKSNPTRLDQRLNTKYIHLLHPPGVIKRSSLKHHEHPAFTLQK